MGYEGMVDSGYSVEVLLREGRGISGKHKGVASLQGWARSQDLRQERQPAHLRLPKDQEDGQADLQASELRADGEGSNHDLVYSHACGHDIYMVWIVDEENPEGPKLLKARCLHCAKEYAYTQGGNTSTINRHWKGKCKKLNAKIASQLIQNRLGFKPVNGDTKIPESATHGHVGFDQAIVKELIAKMIMVHEYSFRMVEHEWFNIVLKYLNPLYTSMGRKAIRAECMRVYKKEKERLKVALQEVEYISLTTDLWTSNQTIGYMCVVAHYIDSDWKMQTRVLAFMELDPPHSGHVIADAVWDCVTDWKIENKVISITLDNASNNDVAVKDLKRFSSHYRFSFDP
ncbi:zinc finger BED domain-containing protein DAYSLEEPER-like [Lolium perenne]|uniref:zinc finger BED domain-containing protein DAYSLEEPER-like n=1 Tax=Lolium perenne TaxID=4522 RepID=UPI003A9A493F